MVHFIISINDTVDHMISMFWSNVKDIRSNFFRSYCRCSGVKFFSLYLIINYIMSRTGTVSLKEKGMMSTTGPSLEMRSSWHRKVIQKLLENDLHVCVPVINGHTKTCHWRRKREEKRISWLVLDHAYQKKWCRCQG